MPIYRIRDWAVNFENNRTRELKKLDWVPIPNKHDGDGFTDLITRRNGAAIFGAWVLMLQVASKCEPRGTLVRQVAGSAAVPHTPESLSRMTRCPVTVIRDAINCCTEIGWIEAVEEQSQGTAKNPAPPCEIVPTESQDDASSHTRARASVPFPSVPFKENQQAEKQTNLAVVGIEGWDEAVEAAARAGMSIDPSPGGDTCQKLWRWMDMETKTLAVRGIYARLECGEYDLERPQYTPTFENYLRGKKWRPSLRPRARDSPTSKTDAAMDQAIEIITRKVGGNVRK